MKTTGISDGRAGPAGQLGAAPRTPVNSECSRSSSSCGRQPCGPFGEGGRRASGPRRAARREVKSPTRRPMSSVQRRAGRTVGTLRVNRAVRDQRPIDLGVRGEQRRRRRSARAPRRARSAATRRPPAAAARRRRKRTRRRRRRRGAAAEPRRRPGSAVGSSGGGRQLVEPGRPVLPVAGVGGSVRQGPPGQHVVAEGDADRRPAAPVVRLYSAWNSASRIRRLAWSTMSMSKREVQHGPLGGPGDVHVEQRPAVGGRLGAATSWRGRAARAASASRPAGRAGR